MLAAVVVAAAGAAFVVFTSQGLPDPVASHFGVSGAADGFMPRRTYIAVMACIVAGLPILLATAGRWTSRLPPEYINLPNKAYWLAPERREASLDSLSRRLTVFAGIVAVFLCFVHWLVVRANADGSNALPMTWFVGGLVVFGVVVVGWTVGLMRRFGGGR